MKLSNDAQILLELSIFLDEDENILLESGEIVAGKIGNTLKALGLSAQQSKGLIHMVLKSGKIMSQVMFHAFKASVGNEESKVKLKELLNTKITKGQLLDFFLKLDAISFHFLTGPIHAVDAIMGWHLWADINRQIINVNDRIKKGIGELEKVAHEVKGKVHKKLAGYIKNIKKLFQLNTKENIRENLLRGDMKSKKEKFITIGNYVKVDDDKKKYTSVVLGIDGDTITVQDENANFRKIDRKNISVVESQIDNMKNKIRNYMFSEDGDYFMTKLMDGFRKEFAKAIKKDKRFKLRGCGSLDKKNTGIRYIIDTDLDKPVELLASGGYITKADGEYIIYVNSPYFAGHHETHDRFTYDEKKDIAVMVKDAMDILDDVYGFIQR